MKLTSGKELSSRPDTLGSNYIAECYIVFTICIPHIHCHDLPENKY